MMAVIPGKPGYLCSLLGLLDILEQTFGGGGYQDIESGGSCEEEVGKSLVKGCGWRVNSRGREGSEVRKEGNRRTDVRKARGRESWAFVENEDCDFRAWNDGALHFAQVPP